jgi:hypothetical protein
MSSFDLNISNYNYNELLNLFKINKNDNRNILSNKIDNTLESIKTSYSDNIYNLFYKGKLIILSIYDLIENKLIEQNERETFVNKINKIPDLETYDEIKLYNKLININMEDIYETKILKDDTNNIDEKLKGFLNTPYYDVGGRVDLNLNNKNNTNYVVNSYLNDVAPGVLNSVKRVVQLQNLNLNSCFRNNYFQSDPCDFLYILPVEIKNVVAMRLVSIEMPNSWYLFSKAKKNNIFEMIIHVGDKNYDYVIEVPEGNYNVETLEQFLNTTYFYESGIDSYLKYIKFSINPFTLKSIFEVIENEDIQDKKEHEQINFSIKFSQNINQNIINTFGWIIGFRMGNYLNMKTLISEGLFDAGGDKYIYLSINDFQYNRNTNNIVCFDKSILSEDVIAKIPMVNGKLSLIINNNESPLAKIRRYNGPITLNRLQIKIMDHFGTIIDLNNMDFSLTLELHILYENFNFKNVTS